MSQRSSFRLLAIGAAGAAAALASPAAFAAQATAAPDLHHAHAAQVGAAAAGHESHALLGRGNSKSSRSGRHSTEETNNWSGYVATGSAGSYTSVSSSWIQPSITCTGTQTASSFWVGLDGAGNSALEQTGTEADCIDGQAEYGAWWEVLPANESPYSVTVEPGDSLTASVVDNGDGTFTMTLTDSTQGWTKTTTNAGSPGYQDATAEVIAEATEVNGQIAALSDFGSVSFTGATVNGSSLDASSPTEFVMVGDSDIKAQPGALSGGSFTDTWEAAN